MGGGVNAGDVSFTSPTWIETMKKVFDKQIHRNDFRLRLLVTNGCNKNCYHCLNDFQDKPSQDEETFLDLEVANRIIGDYCLYMWFIQKQKPQVEFSGGEPGLHLRLTEMLEHAYRWNAKVKVNTNGLAINKWSKKFVDCWHVGWSYSDPDKIKEINGQMQLVVTARNAPYIDREARFYGSRNIPLKLFIDFFDSKNPKIIKAIKDCVRKYPNYDIRTRFTGVQENRGVLCSNCSKKCITLKALWVFPDSTISPCPQKKIREKYKSMLQIAQACEAHKPLP